MFKNPEAMSLAPICNGINKLENVPLRPAVNTKNTIIVPCIVTRAKYISGFITPSVWCEPKKASIIENDYSGQANCNRNNIDINNAMIPINIPVTKNCFEIIL